MQLKQIIEKCGYGFRSLSFHTIRTEQDKKCWMAKSGKKSGGFLVRGRTPEEAVEKLYLKLIEKGFINGI